MKVKKRQQRVLMILDSKNIKYEVVDIAEPGNENPKEFMQSNAKSFGATIGDANPRHPLPPQIFNDDDYCGDYDQFDLSNEIDEIEKFLKLSTAHIDKTVESNAILKLGNGEVIHDQNDKETKEEHKSEEPKVEEEKAEDVPEKVGEHNSREVGDKNGKESEDNKEEVEKRVEPEENKKESEQNEKFEKNEEVEKSEEPEKHEADSAIVEPESKEKLEDGNELSETAAEA